MTGLKQKLISLVEPDLEKIESALRDNLKPHLDLVAETAGHLMFSGGKRLRPLLIVMSARICGNDTPFVTKFATIFEFLHTATLLHDDVVDGATIRRGKPVAHSIWGAPVTVLVGDFLLARALSIAAEAQSNKIIQVVGEITEVMSQGEILQLVRKGDVTFSEEEYMDVILRKTGALIQGACHTGAILGNAPDDKETALKDYGRHLGLVFQIADDILDYTADSTELGKTVGADLREGKLTLPVIYALKQADTADRAVMESIIADPTFSESDFHRLVELLNKYGGIGYAAGVAEKHLALARQNLAGFPPSQEKDILMMIAEYALNRRS